MAIETLTLKQIAVSDMRPGPNVRTSAEPADISALAASLKVRQLHPVVLGPDLSILDGWRRWLAAQEAGLESLWAVITPQPLSPEDRIAAQLVMALHRQDLTEREKVSGCEELAAACPELDQKRLAQRLQVDPATVSRWLCLSGDRVLPSVRDAFFSGRIGLKAAYPISQVDREHQAELLDVALAGATREELTARVRQTARTPSQIRASRVRLTLPDGTSVTVTGEQLSVDDVIEHLSAVLREARRARGQNLDVKTFERVLADRAKASDA